MSKFEKKVTYFQFLIDFVESCISDHKILKKIINCKSRYELFFKLTKFIDEERIAPAYQVYAVLSKSNDSSRDQLS